MSPINALWSLLAGVGLALVTGAGYFVFRGPFLGGEALAAGPTLVAVGVFIVGLIVLALGGSKLAYSLAG